MLIKAGVDISRLDRITRRSLTVVESIFNDEVCFFAITSTYEGNHSAGSLHYANQAYDIAIPAINAHRIFRRIQKALGKDYDVVKEKDHIHIEYDPKGS